MSIEEGRGDRCRVRFEAELVTGVAGRFAADLIVWTGLDGEFIGGGGLKPEKPPKLNGLEETELLSLELLFEEIEFVSCSTEFLSALFSVTRVLTI